MRRLVLYLVLFLNLVTPALAIDMPEGSEQFYVIQGMFEALAIEPQSCTLEDAVINFACGQFKGELSNFQSQLESYIGEFLPGLYLTVDWFDNNGASVRDYRSGKGRYLFAFYPGSMIVVAFTPR